MQDEPLVSIVTPTLNPGPRFLACLDNVKGQSYPRIEHVVIDGGSNDGTVETLERSEVNWISEPDRGQSHAINKGVARAQGTLVSWLGADDLLEPRATELAVSRFIADDGIGLVHGALRVVTPQRTFIASSPAHVSLADFDMRNPIWQPGSLIARWAWERVGGLDESFNYSMDFDLWLRIVNAEIPTSYMKEVLATHEIHPGSKTGSVGIEAFVMECYRSELKIGRTRSAALSLGRAAANAATAHGRVSPSKLREMIDEYLKEGAKDGELPPGLTRAAAASEAALIELQRGLGGLRYLLRFGPWRYPETRRRLLVAFGRIPSRLIGSK